MADGKKSGDAEIAAGNIRFGGACRFACVGRDNRRADGLRKLATSAAVGVRCLLSVACAHCQQLRRNAVVANVRVGTDVCRIVAFCGGFVVQSRFTNHFAENRRKLGVRNYELVAELVEATFEVKKNEEKYC